jgi:hypothetical protein
MDPVFGFFGTVGRVLLAGMFALVPGTLVWMAVLMVYATVRQIGQRFHLSQTG